MGINDRPFKRLRRNSDGQYDFLTFPATVDGVSGGPFRSNVERFLSDHARHAFPPSLIPCLKMWQILFRDGVVLDIVEEDVTRFRSRTGSRSRSVYCDQCRVVGWSGHPVCRKRYHFIIRRESSSSGGSSSQSQLEQGYQQRACATCSNLHSLSDPRCKSCGSKISADEIEEWVNVQLGDTSHHLMHGSIHSNGYGHLLTLNGREGGSKLLSGCDIINFWDRLCFTLSVRKVSVMDVSKKYGMEYRVLHTIAKGHTWYGDWGYQFGAGSYALTLDAYQNAVKTLSTLPLSLFSYQGRKPRTCLQDIIAFYHSISDSQLQSLRDLFSFILRLINEISASSEYSKCENSEFHAKNGSVCAWKRSEVECVEQAIIKVIQTAANGANWVSRRALKGALCKAASPQLLDHCLEHLGGKTAPNDMVVNAQCNPSSSSIEFRLEPPKHRSRATSNRPSKEHLIRDLRLLYDSILHPETMVSYRPHVTRESVIDSATKLLDCKQFVKEYMPDKMAATNPLDIHVWCQVELAEPIDDSAPPPELIMLPQNASVADLKAEVSKAFQEVYPMYKGFEADEMPEYGRLDDSMTLKLLVGSSGSVHVRGRCHGAYRVNRFRMERGMEEWTVDCYCGATDDDGERMLACDTCGDWMHTRCVGIDNAGEIPRKFVCMECANPYDETSNDGAESDEYANRVVQSSEGSKKAMRSSYEKTFNNVGSNKVAQSGEGSYRALLIPCEMTSKNVHTNEVAQSGEGSNRALLIPCEMTSKNVHESGEDANKVTQSNEQSNKALLSSTRRHVERLRSTNDRTSNHVDESNEDADKVAQSSKESSKSLLSPTRRRYRVRLLRQYEKTSNDGSESDQYTNNVTESDVDAYKVAQSSEGSNKALMSSGTCRDEPAITNSHGIVTNYCTSLNVR